MDALWQSCSESKLSLNFHHGNLRRLLFYDVLVQLDFFVAFPFPFPFPRLVLWLWSCEEALFEGFVAAFLAYNE